MIRAERLVGEREWALIPGSMGAVAAAISLLGVQNVNPGSWGTPVYVVCSEDEVKILVELMGEQAARMRDRQ